MKILTAADVPAVAKKAIINGVERNELFLATVLVAVVDLQREYSDILIDGSSEQKATWEKYLPEIEIGTVLNQELYAQIVSDIYEEYARQELTNAVNQYLAENLPANEEVVEWKLVLDPGDGSEPFVVTGDGGTVGLNAGTQTGGIVLTDLPEPEPTKTFVDVLAEREEETAQAFLKEHLLLGPLPAAFDVEAQADNVIPDSAPTQPKWGC